MEEMLPLIVSMVIEIAFVFLIIFLLAIFIKHRSTISAVMFFFLLSAGAFFLLNYPNLSLEEIVGEINEGSLPYGYALGNILPQYGVGTSLISSLTALELPVSLLYISFYFIMFSMLNGDVNKVSFLLNPIFTICLYAVLFILSFIIFKRRNKKKKIYSDYDE